MATENYQEGSRKGSRNNNASDLKDQAATAATTERLAQAAHNRIDQVAEVGANVEKKAREVVRDTSDHAEEIGATISRTKEQIGKNPLMVAGAAFVIGFIVNALLRR